MRTILVAIDFSKGSYHAFSYALNLAKQMKCNLSMIWVDNETGIGSGLQANDNEYRNEAIKNFNELVEKHSAGFEGTISFKLRRGKVYQEVANMATLVEADLIVAGTHGITGFEQYWIGSNAYRIVSYAPCPVITVRFDYPFNRASKNIVLPIDATPDTRQKLPFATLFAKALGAKLHIIALHSTNLKSLQRKTNSNVEQATNYLKKEEIEYTTTEISTLNPTQSIVESAQSINADLIAIMTEQKRSASGLLLGPQAQQLVNFSPIPVLSIHPREIFLSSVR